MRLDEHITDGLSELRVEPDQEFQTGWYGKGEDNTWTFLTDSWIAMPEMLAEKHNLLVDNIIWADSEAEMTIRA